MINYKKYTLKFIISVPLLIIAVILTNYIIDPYQQYRETSYYTFSIKKPRYINAGLVKNYNYDSLIIGSSMMANFDTTKVEEKLKFGTTIKPLTFGGFISEEVDTINTALKHKDIKNIFMGLDFYSFSGFNIPSKKNTRFPLYLYDDSLYNDLEYLFNLSVLKESIKSLSNKYDKEKVRNQLNTLYDWQADYNHLFSGKEVVTDYKGRISNNKHLKSFYSFDIMKENFDKYLLPIIINNKDVQFVFFYPPYSIYEYKLIEREMFLNDVIKFKKYVYSQIRDYKNIEIYDFQIVDSIIMNPRNYKDTTHYHKNINNIIIDMISQKQFLVNEKNIILYSEKFAKQVKKKILFNNTL